jgi:hypothetical protein
MFIYICISVYCLYIVYKYLGMTPSGTTVLLLLLYIHTLQSAICTTDAIGNSDHIYVTRNVVQQIRYKFKIQKVDKMEQKRQRNSYLSFRVT